ncbi:Nuclease-related domain protein [Bacillus sp. THAF10]|uniref:nuclease-related domain-containing protein n=1 Tax=Bacillus sp. THAF10 TaxID=2587848 RepID=UPI00126858D6|nr:nuclease-related domain-containing protein [Bacillus sp. THAF10]QFT87277.1 Nuclease-related domain protein [Bacillus sp. THAF10]
MIKKEREKPFKLLAHEAAMRRVPKNHPKYPQMEKEFSRLHYGYKGEKAMDYFSSFLPHENYQVLHGLRIPDTKGRHFQMDSLLITPTHCLILDSKYTSGKLEFDEDTGSLIRHNDDGYERLGDPLAQLARQKIQLASLIKELKLPPIKIQTQVVISHKNATLFRKSPTLLNKIVFHTSLPTRIQAIDNTQKNSFFSSKETNKLVKTLLKRHKDDTSFNLMESYGLTPSDFIKGIICDKCSYAPMKKHFQKWECPACGHRDEEPVSKAIRDYPLLGLGNTITNKQFREFVCILSTSISSKVLLTLNLPHKGTTKGRTYFLK